PLWPAPTPFSTARSCSPPPTPRPTATWPCSSAWASPPSSAPWRGTARSRPRPCCSGSKRPTAPSTTPPSSGRRGMDLEAELGAQLAERRAANLYRERRLLASPQGGRVVLDGRQVLAFSSNDYLGLANHPDIVRAFAAAAERFGVGSGAAHLVCGHASEHQALEEELAAFCGRDRALLFATDYMANLGAISALVASGDLVLEDRLNHASLLDGG